MQRNLQNVSYQAVPLRGCRLVGVPSATPISEKSAKLLNCTLSIYWLQIFKWWNKRISSGSLWNFHKSGRFLRRVRQLERTGKLLWKSENSRTARYLAIEGSYQKSDNTIENLQDLSFLVIPTCWYPTRTQAEHNSPQIQIGGMR